MQLQKASLSDIDRMMALVSEEIERGTILKRDADEIATNIRSYTIAKEDDRVIGYAALHIHSPTMAEIRSLIVDNGARDRGIGKALVQALLQEAKALQLKEVLVLTYIPEFFKQFGFIEIEKDQIPDHKIWADCIKCIHFPICNEVAMLYKVR